jgi:hypothetical protein
VMETVEYERSRNLNSEEKMNFANKEVERLNQIIAENREKQIRGIKENKNDENEMNLRHVAEKKELNDQIENLKRLLQKETLDFRFEKEHIKQELIQQNEEQSESFLAHDVFLKKQFYQQNEQLKRISVDIREERKENENKTNELIASLDKANSEITRLKRNFDICKLTEEKSKEDATYVLETSRTSLLKEAEDIRAELSAMRNRSTEEMESLRKSHTQRVELLKEEHVRKMDAVRTEHTQRMEHYQSQCEHSVSDLRSQVLSYTTHFRILRVLENIFFIWLASHPIFSPFFILSYYLTIYF